MPQKKGCIPWNKGKKGIYSEETLKKMSIAAIGMVRHRSEHSDETKRKISESRIGELNPRWNGGRTPLIKQISSHFKYRQWRSDIFTRDNFICQLCGNNRILNAHHIHKIMDIIKEYGIETIEQALKCEKLWNINNGITLCKECHKKEHRKR